MRTELSCWRSIRSALVRGWGCDLGFMSAFTLGPLSPTLFLSHTTLHPPPTAHSLPFFTLRPLLSSTHHSIHFTCCPVHASPYPSHTTHHPPRRPRPPPLPPSPPPYTTPNPITHGQLPSPPPHSATCHTPYRTAEPILCSTLHTPVHSTRLPHHTETTHLPPTHWQCSSTM